MSLPSLLSQTLVAFIIEFDNEFERQMPHRTTNHGSTPGSHNAPWLVSMVMWLKFLRFVRDDGTPTGELKRVTGTTDKAMAAWLTRLGKWWGYIAVEPPAIESGAAALVRPTVAGRKAQAIWPTLEAVIEARWQERFGKEAIDRLREALGALVIQLDPALPDCLPILGYGLFSREVNGPRTDSSPTLPVLLSKVLLAFAIEFERSSDVSLAISANVLRLLNEEAVRVRDFPRLAGVSKEAIAMALSFLEKQGYAVVKPDSAASRTKVLVLTAKGKRARDAYHQLVLAIENRWQADFGDSAIRDLRDSLQRLVGEPPAQTSPLLRGLDPYPDGWRAALPKPECLPHYPMILHRGGFPDGS